MANILLTFYVVFIAVLPTYAANKDFKHIQDNCIGNCPLQNSTDGTANDLWCDETCSIEHCITGCRRWRRAIHSSCYAACNSTQGHVRGHALYCLMGCNSAVSQYVGEMKEWMGRIAAPSLIVGSITNTSVALRWNLTALRDRTATLVSDQQNINTAISLQWRHSQPQLGGTWEAVPSPDGADDQWQATVKGLQPYTSYRFRLTVVLASDREPLTSDETPAITTLPYGLPSTAPLNLQAVVLDANHISISWDPPLFPNGPLISYSLNIKETFPRGPQVYPGFQDIVGTNSSRSYVFVHLSPNTTYTIAVASRNAEGTGPEAVLQATTPPIDKTASSLEPFILIVVDSKMIYRHATGLVNYDESSIHESPMNAITGLAVHPRQGALFMADDHGSVYELSLKPNGKSDVRTSWQVSDDSIVSIKGLSVDWLSDRLYLLLEIADGSVGGSWQIARCKLNGRELVHVITDMTHKPFQIEVDPFNGFLVWGVKGAGAAGGLYQVDLADLVGSHPLSAVVDKGKIKRILVDGSVSAFKIDPANSRVFAMVAAFQQADNKTILAIPYHSESNTPSASPTVIRHSMALVDDVSSLTYLDGVFYWINKGHSVYEEVDSFGNFYANNFAPVAHSRHTCLVLCDSRSQPIPIPLTPIRNLQALFGSNSAHIKWDPPLPIAQRGRGAWQNWSYRMQIEDLHSGASVFRDDIFTTEMDIEELRPNTSYSITVQPSSAAGHGVSTSAAFSGKTLPDGNWTVYWATGGSIQQSSAIGKDVVAFADVTDDKPDPVEIVSMAYMYDDMYVVTNSSRMYRINLQTRNVSRLENIEAISVATDWLGRKIYWSSSKRQTIGRSWQDGSQTEWLPIIGIATSLAIHSRKGKLVWCTGHSVEGSPLNAEERQTFWSSGLRSGNQAVGMTMDYEREEIYWMVLQLTGASLLYKANINSHSSATLVNQVGLSPARGPIQYMSDRLLWLQELSVTIVISDLNGANSYLLGSPKHQRVSSLLVVDKSRWSMPGNLNVIPDPVNAASIAVNQIGDAELYVTWFPVTNVNYGSLSYDIRINSAEGNITAVTTNAAYTLPSSWKTPPYSEIFVSIRAFTVWSSAGVSDARLRSPSSTPDVPMNPRTFVSFIRDEDPSGKVQGEVTVDFRWSPPIKSNGILEGYRIECWRERNETKESTCQDGGIIVGPNVTDYTARSLSPNDTYYFTVQAFTKVGYGPKTTPVIASTAKETPVPQLLVFTANALWLADLDKHKSLNKSLAKGVSSVQFPPVAVAFINQERELYWIDTQGDLYAYSLDTHLLKKIHHLNGTGRSLIVDWVSRNIYWSQTDVFLGGSSVYRLDLNEETSDEPVPVPRLVLRDTHNMARLVEVDPFTSRLIWMSVSKNGTGALMTSDIDGKNSRSFFTNEQGECDSTVIGTSASLQPLQPLVVSSSVTTVDWSNAQNPRLLWLSAGSEDVWSSDWRGCHSVIELTSSELRRAGGWPPSSLAVDRLHFYWSNTNEGRVYKIRRSSPVSAFNKASRYSDDPSSKQTSASAFTSRMNDVSAEMVADIRKIATLGSNFQPLPDKDCLAPLALSYLVQVINSTDRNVTLSMPLPLRPEECTGMTMAPPRYHLYYGPADQCQTNLSNCLVHTTSKDMVVLNDLLPYTTYTVRVRVTNYYRPLEHSLPIGDAVMFSTKAGVPYKPENVTVFATSPRTVRVQWAKPSVLNGPNVTYHVYWQEIGSPSRSRELAEGHHEWPGGIHEDKTRDDQPYRMDIPALPPNRNFTFWVRVFSVNSKWNTSDPVVCETFKNPEPIVLTNAFSNAITVEWQTTLRDLAIQSHALEITLSKHANWIALNDSFGSTQPGHLYKFTAANLTSLTSYSFRLHLQYSPNATSFYWPDKEEGLVLSTRGNAPAQPRTPQAKKSPDNLVELWWGPTPTNGYPIQNYILEMKTIEDRDQSHNNNSGDKPVKLPAEPLAPWVLIYNGSDHFYVAHNLSSGPRYQFRVQAVNEMGASEFSIPSATIQIDSLVREGAPSNANLILSVSVSALIAFCSVMTMFLFYACRRPPFEGRKGKGDVPAHLGPGSEMTDLATLRELPQRESFIQQNNAIYGVGAGDCDLAQELALLPHIRFDDLSITKFLGRGAFGEVFEGRINQLPVTANSVTSRVAVKTLRKGATEQEKSEFLKEAILMSHFKHKHIIRLLGVCLDADPNFILLELMEGGDLLSFLRNNRPSPSRNPQQHPVVGNGPVFCQQLSLLDLVSMCVDVAKGCCYLEELHYVHRDLAARNCLVSSLDPHHRVVKIGDFGLARDIYRNDYYRKEGEGLLPVRWMAPESLVDGVFTSQTDVWSFGVLLWEILTLGQQPYPARTNLQVLHFVRSGGRLDRPPNCPDSLFDLMMSCWSYDPSMRPTFTQCLSELLNLQDKLENSPFTAVHNGHYLGTLSNRDGCDNKSYFQDENHNSSSKGSSWAMQPTSHAGGSDESCAYLEQHVLEPGAALYTNDVAAVLNGLVATPNRRPTLDRCRSARESNRNRAEINRMSDRLLTRSNSMTGGPAETTRNDRYLELLSDSLSCSSSRCNDGYEMPRYAPYGPLAKSAQLQQSSSSISSLGDSSDVTHSSRVTMNYAERQSPVSGCETAYLPTNTCSATNHDRATPSNQPN